VRDITDAVDLADRTFYRYFDSKEDLLLDDVRVYFDAVEQWVGSRPRDESPMRSLIEWVLAMRDSFVIGEALVGAEFIDRNASAEGRMHQMLNDHQDRLAAIFATRLGEAAIPFVAHHYAAAAGAAFIQGLGRYLKNPAYSPWDYGLETLRVFSAGVDPAAAADIAPFVPVPEPLPPMPG
jgi:AcrR family transcriptional regulator